MVSKVLQGAAPDQPSGRGCMAREHLSQRWNEVTPAACAARLLHLPRQSRGAGWCVRRGETRGGDLRARFIHGGAVEVTPSRVGGGWIGARKTKHASSTALRQPWWVPFRRTARSPSPRPNRRARINRILINIHPHISQTSVLALRREIAAPANQTFHMHCAQRIRYVPAQGST